MRKITRDSVNAFMSATKFKRSNTEVRVQASVTVLILFGNQIAYRYNNPERTLAITTCGWKSNATKERLNGIPDVHIQQEKSKWYLNGVLWDGKLIDIDKKS